MTITNIGVNDRFERFLAAAGQTVFSFDFPIYEAAHLRVTRQRANAETLLALGGDYTVAGAGADGGGSVTLAAPSLAGDIITIESAQPNQRSTQFSNGGDFLAGTIEAEFNRVTISLQQLAAASSRALKFPITDGTNPQVPAAPDRNGKLLGFDTGGNLVAVPGTDQSATAVTALGATTSRLLAERARDTLNARDFGATGNGVTDDAPAIQAALSTGAATIDLSEGTYRLLSPLVISTNGQRLVGRGARGVTLAPVGNFNILTVQGCEHGGAENLLINAAGMTGGHAMQAVNAERVILSRVQVNSPFNGVRVAGCNNVTLRNIDLANIRGTVAYFLDGSTLRTDIVRMYACGSSFTTAAGQAGGIALHWLGNVHSVECYGWHAVLPGRGLLAQGSAAGFPFGLVMVGTAFGDFCAFEAIRLERAENVYISTGGYGQAAGYIDGIAWNPVNAVFIGDDCKYVQIHGGSWSSRRAPFRIGGEECKLIGLDAAVFWPAGYAGQFPAIHVTDAARNTIVNGCTLGGRTGIGAQVSYAVQVDPGAQDTIIVNNNVGGYFAAPVLDLAAPGQTTQANNSDGRHNEDRFVRTTNFGGANAHYTPTITAGVITGLTAVDVGDGYWTLPAASVVGDGAGATVTPTLNGLGGVNLAIATGGSGYTWATIIITPAVTVPTIRSGRGAGAADLRAMARGGGAVLLANDRGLSLAALADANAANHVRTTGRATGGAPEIDVAGPDSNIALRLTAKGSGPVELQSAGGVSMPASTFATLPAASVSTGLTRRVTDRNQRLATSDGSNWRDQAGAILT